jgi:predicted exporter
MRGLVLRLAAFGALLCAPAYLFVLWAGVNAIRDQFGMVAFLGSCAACMVAFIGFAALVDKRAERQPPQHLDRYSTRGRH